MSTHLRSSEVSRAMTRREDNVGGDEGSAADMSARVIDEGRGVRETIIGRDVSVDDAGGKEVSGDEGIYEGVVAV